MLCDICGERPPIIHIEGVGHFCEKCNNERMLKLHDMEDDFNYSENIMIAEADGTMHAFHVSHLIMGAMVQWTAEENGGGYEICDISWLGDDTKQVIKRFFGRIISSVLTKTIERRPEGPHYISNCLHRDGKVCSLKSKGCMTISTDGNGHPAFLIDGELFSPDEFAQMLGPQEGFILHYQVRDSSEAPLGEHEILMPVDVSRDRLLTDWELLIDRCSDLNGYMSKDQVLEFLSESWEILRDLDGACKTGGEIMDEARATGLMMRKMIHEIRCEREGFPEHIEEQIMGIIDPFGLLDQK